MQRWLVLREKILDFRFSRLEKTTLKVVYIIKLFQVLCNTLFNWKKYPIKIVSEALEKFIIISQTPTAYRCFIFPGEIFLLLDFSRIPFSFYDWYHENTFTKFNVFYFQITYSIKTIVAVVPWNLGLSNVSPLPSFTRHLRPTLIGSTLR